MGYSVNRLSNGLFELNCQIGGTPQKLTARWVTGQTYPQILDQAEQKWLQTSPNDDHLQVFARGRWGTLGK